MHLHPIVASFCPVMGGNMFDYFCQHAKQKENVNDKTLEKNIQYHTNFNKV
jgi:hypothetical protein